MRKKLSQKELAEIRKKELAKKELEFELGRDIRIEHEKRDIFEKSLEDKNPFILGSVNFFGTMFFGYGTFLALKFFTGRFLFLIPSMYRDTFFEVFHVLIWGVSIIAVLQKRSPIEKIFDRF